MVLTLNFNGEWLYDSTIKIHIKKKIIYLSLQIIFHLFNHFKTILSRLVFVRHVKELRKNCDTEGKTKTSKEEKCNVNVQAHIHAQERPLILGGC